MASSTATLRKTLSAAGLVRLIRCRFAAVADPRRSASVRHTLPDTLMAALAMFQLKSPSLLQFDRMSRDADRPTLFANLQRLFRLGTVPPPSDSQMRRILDRVPPAALRPAFRAVHSGVQRGRVLEDFKVLDGRVLIALDGTALFGSTTVSCEHCGVSRRSNGTTHHYHQLLAAVVVSPYRRTVLPIDFEPIVASDGQSKDCCEANAARRLIPSLARQYPKLSRRFVINEDGLSANGPHVKRLLEHGMDFIIGAKPGSLETLFAEFDQRRRRPDGGVVEFEHVLGEPGAGRPDRLAVSRAAGKGLGADTIRGGRFANGLSLNAAHEHIKVNLLEFWEVTHPGTDREKTVNWAWITSLAITCENAMEIAECARSRWHVENQTFNTLKNQGYHLEHNYGHGKRYLSSTLAGLMLLSFLIDQVQEHACALYKEARRAAGTKVGLWEAMRTWVHGVGIVDWAMLWNVIAGRGFRIEVVPDTG